MSPLRFLFLTLSLPFISAIAAADSPPTVYEVLKSYGFPIGLLPQGVTRYNLDASTGKFTVYLDKSCSFTIQGYDLKYKTTITGTISTGKIKNLSGIQVKILLFWVNIIEVSQERDNLELSVGIVSADFPVDNFDESPSCDCGFDCVNGGKSEGKFGLKKILPLIEV